MHLHGSIRGDISIKNVDFTYEHTGIKALDRLTLNIKEGEKIALIGRTGSGKTTIAQLLLRMFDPQQGEILIDNRNIQQIDLRCSEGALVIYLRMFSFSAIPLPTILPLDSKKRKSPASQPLQSRASVDNEIRQLATTI